MKLEAYSNPRLFCLPSLVLKCSTTVLLFGNLRIKRKEKEEKCSSLLTFIFCSIIFGKQSSVAVCMIWACIICIIYAYSLLCTSKDELHDVFVVMLSSYIDSTKQSYSYSYEGRLQLLGSYRVFVFVWYIS